MVFARVDRLELLIRSSCSLSSLAGSFVCRKVIENSNNYAWLATRHEQEQYEHKEKGRVFGFASSIKSLRNVIEE